MIQFTLPFLREVKKWVTYFSFLKEYLKALK